VKCQGGSPVLRDDERRGDSRTIEERIEVPYMIGKPVLYVGLSRLAEPDEIRFRVSSVTAMTERGGGM
jgi:hypothetical protein